MGTTVDARSALRRDVAEDDASSPSTICLSIILTLCFTPSLSHAAGQKAISSHPISSPRSTLSMSLQ